MNNTNTNTREANKAKRALGLGDMHDMLSMLRESSQGVQEHVFVEMPGKVFSNPAFHASKKLAKEGWSFVAAHGTDRMVQINGVCGAFVPVLINRRDGEFVWDDCYPSFYSAKHHCLKPKPSLGPVGSPTAHFAADGYLISLMTPEGMKPAYGAPLFTGGDRSSSPMTVILQTAVGNKEAHGDDVRDDILRQLLVNAPHLATQGTIELLVVLFFEYLLVRPNTIKNKSGAVEDYVYATVKGDCFAVYGRTFDAGRFVTQRAAKATEMFQRFAERSSVSNLRPIFESAGASEKILATMGAAAASAEASQETVGTKAVATAVADTRFKTEAVSTVVKQETAAIGLVQDDEEADALSFLDMMAEEMAAPAPTPTPAPAPAPAPAPVPAPAQAGPADLLRMALDKVGSLSRVDRLRVMGFSQKGAAKLTTSEVEALQKILGVSAPTPAPAPAVEWTLTPEFAQILKECNEELVRDMVLDPEFVDEEMPEDWDVPSGPVEAADFDFPEEEAAPSGFDPDLN